MKYLLPFFLLTLGACNTPAEKPDANPEITVIQTPVARPQLQSFSFNEPEALAVADGAGCYFTVPGLEGDSCLFASAENAIIRVQDKFEIFKLAVDRLATDSAEHWENDRYRLEVHSVTDSVLEGGSLLHGTLLLTDKQSGAQSETPFTGNCGC